MASIAITLPAMASANSELQHTYEQFVQLTRDIFSEIRDEVSSDRVLDKLFVKRQVLVTTDTLHNQEPETFTKEKLVEALLRFLGYPRTLVKGETALTLAEGKHREADYKLLVRTRFILLEAEPINKDLDAPNSGATQVKEWLSSRFTETEYGIATDGITWRLLKVSASQGKVLTVKQVDLLPFFTEQFTQTLENSRKQQDLFKDFVFYFSKDTILDALAGETSETLDRQSEITARFYRDYIKYIFGIERGERSANCLLNKVTPPTPEAPEGDRRLFSVITMNRLIFTKFLQDKGIIPNHFLSDLIEEYRKSPNNPTTFYQTYLRPFFYEVLNKPTDERHQPRGSIIFSTIPYLNGGLFVETIPSEREFDINNDILFEIIGPDFLASYNLTYSEEGPANKINPDILGRVFEKTINYITSKSESFNKKQQGAFYTPTEITSYLCDKSLKQFLYSESLRELEAIGYSQKQLNKWRDYDDLLLHLPDDKKSLEQLRHAVLQVKVLDPACGSGHFLKDAGDLLLSVNRLFCSKLDLEFDAYSVMKTIIVNNLYGVDIDANAVEIAKLRLWMSLIDLAHSGDKIHALPNIEYNIRKGNSLIGFIHIPEEETSRIDEFVELDITSEIQPLAQIFPNEVRKINNLVTSPTIENLVKIKDLLVGLYKKDEDPKIRHTLKLTIEKILQPIHAQLTHKFLGYIHRMVEAKGTKTLVSYEQLQYLNPFHWVTEFSEIIESKGFNVIIENPPYDVMKPRDREFFDSFHIEFRFLPKLEQDKVKKKLLAKPAIAKEYQRYKDSFATYQLLIKYLPEFQLQNNSLDGLKWKKSDPNDYRLFIERSNQLLKDSGRLGMICPKGFIGELGSTAIRRFLLTSYSDFEFREFNNKTDEKLIFDEVDPNFRFVVFTYLKEKGQHTVGYFYCSKLNEIDRDYESFEKNPLAFYLKLNSELCILQWIRSSIEYQILEKLSAFPMLGDTQTKPTLQNARELDMTLDRDKFTSNKTSIPLWEGSLINHYSQAKQSNLFVKPKEFHPTDDFFHDRIVIRTIMPNSTRKFYSTILPPKIALGNSLVYFRPTQTKREQYYIVALLNSLLIEYRGKQLLSKMTLNQYVIDLLPIPRNWNTLYDQIADKSATLILDKVQQDKRQAVMNQIDALVFRLFGLTSLEANFILDTFDISTVDKNDILSRFNSYGL